MEYVLVSSCLLGAPVRYDGRGKPFASDILQRWVREGRVVLVCPEVEGGLAVPRPAAEIAGGAGGRKVLAGEARVRNKEACDVTAEFIVGAQNAMQIARKKNIRIAVLKEGSPSCGSGYTYDGSFTSTRIQQPGVTTALLQEAGIQVFNEQQLREADELLRI
ncbi:MAG: DUF523 domain-containing protein [Gammaproteobacteria bacterium]|nr:MAG: DUF523 domain-containing protein [Gammaproteobacteria bacterium]